MLGVSGQTVSNWETGQKLPSAPSLRALAMLFGVSMDKIDFDRPAIDRLDWSRETDETRRALGVIHDRLRTEGVEPGPDGFSLGSLSLLANLKGLKVSWSSAGDGYMATASNREDWPVDVRASWLGWSAAVAAARALDAAIAAAKENETR